MSRTLLRLALLTLLILPASAFALGLGEIHLNSALNEPLNAEIELVSATPDELDSSGPSFLIRSISKPRATRMDAPCCSCAPLTR
jgi:hypothetical protein